MPTMKIKRKVIKLLSLFLIVIAIVFSISLKQNDPQLQPSTTVSSFVMALVKNDERMLMEIVVPQQRDRISEWLEFHKPFFCPPGLDFPRLDFPPNIFDLRYTRIRDQYVNIHPNPDHNTKVNFYTLYQCRVDIDSFYGRNFEVRDIVIELKDNRWYIKSWRFTCESKSLYGCA